MCIRDRRRTRRSSVPCKRESRVGASSLVDILLEYCALLVECQLEPFVRGWSVGGQVRALSLNGQSIPSSRGTRGEPNESGKGSDRDAKDQEGCAPATKPCLLYTSD